MPMHSWASESSSTLSLDVHDGVLSFNQASLLRWLYFPSFFKNCLSDDDDLETRHVK